MSSLNRVMIMGRLGQDPELRYTQNQTPIVTLNVATTEFGSRDGQRQETTEWHRVVVWSKQAENCAKYLAKGRVVFVEGRLQTRSWEDKAGQKRYTTEIIANNVQFVGGAAQGQGQGQGSGINSGDFGAPKSGNAGPFGGGYESMSNPGPSSSQGSFMDVDTSHLDDIPF